jgi:hypothetical protein
MPVFRGHCRMVAAYSTQGAEIIISAPMRPDYPVGLACLHEERRVLFVTENGQALEPHTGHETWPDLSSKIPPRDRENCRAIALAVDPNHLATNWLGPCTRFAHWNTADVTVRVFSSRDWSHASPFRIRRLGRAWGGFPCGSRLAIRGGQAAVGIPTRGRSRPGRWQ